MTDGPAPDAAPRRRLPRGLVGAVTVTVLLGIYVWAIGGRGLAMLRSGEPVLVAIGAAVLVIPLLVLGLVAREFWLAARVQRMADILAAGGRLPVDELPRSPGGRIDRDAADAAFADARAAVESDPDSWEAWYHLAFAYDAARDRRRARAALRRASALFTGER
ncbi:hypothetical protein [Isoptericola aurantiacus]|uniref:hypothetical protein n=1 Tax=Isoptericola aurantiacus TaxID=3377839 RepID=UPI00383A5A63